MHIIMEEDVNDVENFMAVKKNADGIQNPKESPKIRH